MNGNDAEPSGYTPLEQAERFLQAADLIDNYGWCKKVVARDRLKRGVRADSPSALCFCVMGALYRLVGPDEGQKLAAGFAAFLTAQKQIRPLDKDQTALILLARWNDTRQNRMQVLRWMRTYASHLEGTSA